MEWFSLSCLNRGNGSHNMHGDISSTITRYAAAVGVVNCMMFYLALAGLASMAMNSCSPQNRRLSSDYVFSSQASKITVQLITN